MKKILALLALCVTTVAAYDLVVYVQSTGDIVSFDKQYEIPSSRLVPGGFMLGTNLCGILSTTNDPTGKTNIVQLADKTILDPADVSNDPENNPNLQLKRVLRALVKTINQRLPAGQKITAAELRQAIKEEL